MGFLSSLIKTAASIAVTPLVVASDVINTPRILEGQKNPDTPQALEEVVDNLKETINKLL